MRSECSMCSRVSGRADRCTRCRLTRGLRTPLGHLGLALLVLGLAAALPTAAHAQAQDTCNGNVSIFYTSGVPFAIPGAAATADNTYRVRIRLGTAEITGGTDNVMTVQEASFALDCTNGTTGSPPCTDDGAKIKYLGNIGDVANCTNGVDPVLPVTTHGISNAPNQVAFTFVLASNTTSVENLVLPADTSGAASCTFQFDVQVEARSSADGTPARVEQEIFYSNADCDNNLSSTASNAAGINTCGQASNGLQVDCNDSNGCTSDTCNTTTGECSFVDTVTATCDDSNSCTVDACNPATGLCTNTDTVTATCGDGNACTVDACNPATGLCTNTDTVSSTCNDNNSCTVDACNPATGLCTNTGTCGPVCGNGIIEPGEQCDDGNTNNNDGCRNNCTRPPEVIPTLSEWAQLILALIMTAGAGWHLRRRRTSRTD